MLELSTAHNAILKTLLTFPVQTEHELAKAVAAARRMKDTDVMPTLGKTLIELRDEGLVWAGQLFAGQQFMWAACLTKAGRDRVKHLSRG
jgi:hypothetical protein